jgi:hypothetical protein
MLIILILILIYLYIMLYITRYKSAVVSKKLRLHNIMTDWLAAIYLKTILQMQEHLMSTEGVMSNNRTKSVQEF